MSTESNAPQATNKTSNQRHRKNPFKATAFVCALAVALFFGRWVLAQSLPAPVLAIMPLGTNQILVTITNNIGTADYDLQWTPVLENPNFPWSFAAIGVPGGTNFLLEAEGYPTTFFRAILDTNAIPLWEAADPNNPNSAILKVTILGPANGANLQ